MGWYHSNSWSGYADQGLKSKHDARGKETQKKTWGSWKCECGNVQTGSQCKKWWNTHWGQPRR